MITATYNMFSFNRLLNSPRKCKDAPLTPNNSPKLVPVTDTYTNEGSQGVSRRSCYPADDIQQRAAEFQLSNSFMYVPSRCDLGASLLASKRDEKDRTLTNAGEGGKRMLLEESAVEIKTALKRLYARGRALGLQEEEMVKYIMRNAFESLTDSETEEEEILYSPKSQNPRVKKLKRPRISKQEWDLIKVFPSNWKPTRKGEGLPADFILAWFNFRLQKIGLGLWKSQSRRWQYVKDLYGIGTTHGCWLQRD